MADFTAKDVQALRQATGAGMMDAKKALTGERRRPRGRHQVAPREGPGQGGRPHRPRQQPGRGRRGPSTGPPPPSSSSSARPTSSPSPTTSPPSSRSSPTVAAKGEGGRDDQGRRHRRPQGPPQGEHRAGPGRPSRPPTATCSTPTCTARTGAASTAWSSSSTAAPPSWPTTRRARRLHQARRHPARRGPEAEVAEERATLESITQAEGKPEAALDKIVEGRLSGWFKERVLLEQGFVKDEKTTVAAARRRPGRALRPGHRRRLTTAVTEHAWSRVRPQALRRGLRRRAGPRHRRRTVRTLAQEIVEVRRNRDVDIAVVVGGGNIWRGKTGAGARHGPRPGRLHGHARHRHQRPRPAGPPRAAGPAHAGAVRDPHGPDRRALHPASGHPPPREGPGRHLRRRDRQPVLHHRHHGRAACGRDRGRRGAQGHPLGRRRHLHRRPEARTRRPPSSTRSPTSTCSTRASRSWTRPRSPSAWTTTCPSSCST